MSQPIGLSEDEFLNLLDHVQDFRDRVISPQVVDWERNRVFPAEVIASAHQLGLLGMEIDPELGGLGMSFSQKLRVLDVLSEVSMPYAFSLVNSHNVAARLARHGTEEQRSRFLSDLLTGDKLGSSALTEPNAGSDFSAIATQATPDAKGWRLNGEKAWITNAASSTVIVAYVQTDPGSRARGIASFLIDGTQPGFQRVAPYDLIGSHAIGTGGFRLDNYLASEADLLAPAGEGFSAALATINEARTYVASMCCAMIEASLRSAVGYAAERESFGKPIIEHQGLSWQLARVANQLEAARALTNKAVAAIEYGDSESAVLPAAHAKKFATEIAESAIAACAQAMGANGLREEHLIGHRLTAARVANYVDGSTEIMTDRIAKSLSTTYGSV
ncbi:MAG: acyl-CoA dehydrogenase family protein [Acidimicrobiales bacterium]|nr:acyl-CoA dehydrogenase family protein [Acidimicrobiales bacterium]|tara:strand:+ start:426 stop:1592 length:1167 start_codon:yes stop_codon:yes gene_type:complete